MEEVNVGDIVAVHYIKEVGYDMREQADVPLSAFPVPVLVTGVDEVSIWVSWVHPTNPVRWYDWHFKIQHLSRMELIE